MLNVQTEEGLSRLISLDVGDIRLAAECADDDVEELRLWSPFDDKQPRDVIDVRGLLRFVQDRIYVRLLSNNSIGNSMITQAFRRTGSSKVHCFRLHNSVGESITRVGSKEGGDFDYAASSSR